MSESIQPVVLITGLPGHGKTLYAVSQFCKGKPSVYTCGLKGSVFPECDATKWFETPSGSVVVVDEAWKWFAPRTATQDPPTHYAKVPEIRHSGHTLVLITQDPKDLDARIRRRVGKHYHVVRVFGTERARVHEWNECQEDVSLRADTEASLWEYDKSAYALYKSAEVHKIKTEIPRRIKRIPIYVGGAILAILGGLWWMYTGMTERTPQVAQKAGKQADTAGGLFGAMNPKKPPGTPQTAPQASPQAPLTPEAYMASFVPRIAGLPHTAPRYDELTKPTEAPAMAGCVKTAASCKCYTQQGTPIDTGPDLCGNIVANGYFADWKPQSQQQTTSAPATPVPPSIEPAQVDRVAAAAGQPIDLLDPGRGVRRPSP